jgi:hypothetical protein
MSYVSERNVNRMNKTHETLSLDILRRFRLFEQDFQFRNCRFLVYAADLTSSKVMSLLEKLSQ